MLGGDRQGPLRRVELEAERACRVSDQGDAGQQACLERGPVVRRPLDGPPQVVEALAAVPVEMPEPRQLGGQAATAFRVGRRQPPVQGRAEVVVLPLEAGPPDGEVALELGFEGLGEGQEPGEVAIPGRRGLAGFDQPVGGVLADRLQEPVARFAVALLGDDERLVHQAS